MSRSPARKPNGVTLVVGLAFVTLAVIALGVMAWGLWWQFVKIAAPLALVILGLVGVVWSQQRSSRRHRPGPRR